jgi:hypothetical protein
MRQYHDLSNYYPPFVSFGKYTITRDINNINVANNIIDYYNGNHLIKLFNYNFKMMKNGDEPVMDTSDFEVLTNKYFLDNATGDIMVFGLGMGFIIFPLLDDPSITSIKIVEYDQEVIDYVGNIIKYRDINNKVTIVLGDVKTYYQNNTNEFYDFIYIDYWGELNENAYDEMLEYPSLYSNFKKDDNSIIFSWCQDIKHLILVL